MIITFCGHSDFHGNDMVEQQILLLLYQYGENQALELYLGGYGAFDEFAYCCCKKYKEQQQNAKLIFITPYLTESYQNHHLKQAEQKYDAILYPPLEKVPYRFAIRRRNQWMAENADLIISYVNRSHGGAYQFFDYATRRNKRVINLAAKFSEC